MNGMGKSEQYHKLISSVRLDYLSRSTDRTTGGTRLLWCDDCKQEINLWTYWQNSLDARIMLVGQDWGCPFDDGSKETMRRIQGVNDGSGRPFFPNHNDDAIWTTDRNLGELFKILGYDIWQKQPDLFFTNFVLGYRERGTSGPFRQKWIRDDAPYFKRLAEIIEPDVMICLGKNTFEGVVYALTGQMKRVKGFNRFLDSGENNRAVQLDTWKTVSVYAVAHCGTIGTMNRNRSEHSSGQITSSSNISRQKQDWARFLKLDVISSRV